MSHTPLAHLVYSLPACQLPKGKVFDTDEGPRPQTSLEKLSTLPTVFKKNGTVTAGNASGVGDSCHATPQQQQHQVDSPLMCVCVCPWVQASLMALLR